MKILGNKTILGTLFGRRMRAFSLIEMLIVVAIIGLLSAMILPSFGGLTKSNQMSVATRQLLDDVAFARQTAINNRARVYIVFVAPEFWNKAAANPVTAASSSYAEFIHLGLGQYSTYAIYTDRSIGDQPGSFNAR